jgi:hypothetical protein
LATIEALMEKLDEGFLKIAQSSDEIFEQRLWVVPKVSQPSKQRPQDPQRCALSSLLPFPFQNPQIA